MKTILTLAALTAALAVPAAALGAQAPPSANQLAQQACKQQQAALGKATFRETYGANAFGKCVSQAVRSARAALAAAAKACRKQGDAAACTTAKAKAAVRAAANAVVAAAKTCKAERAADRAAFRTTYGFGEKKVAAFARCVNAKLSAAP